MLCTGYTKVWELASGELVRLDGARGTTLRVTRGTLWITLENDTRDIVLSAGDSYTIDRGGLTLVEAQGTAAVCVLAHYVDEIRHRRNSRRATAASPRGSSRCLPPTNWVATRPTTERGSPGAPTPRRSARGRARRVSLWRT